MKKTLVFVLLLGLVGAFVFAQDAPALKFNGYMNFGAAITNDTVNTNLVAQGQDSGQRIGRFQLEGKYDASNWGWAFRMRENANWILDWPGRTAALSCACMGLGRRTQWHGHAQGR